MVAVSSSPVGSSFRNKSGQVPERGQCSFAAAQHGSVEVAQVEGRAKPDSETPYAFADLARLQYFNDDACVNEIDDIEWRLDTEGLYLPGTRN